MAKTWVDGDSKQARLRDAKRRALQHTTARFLLRRDSRWMASELEKAWRRLGEWEPEPATGFPGGQTAMGAG
jgi:hypothetical protein